MYSFPADGFVQGRKRKEEGGAVIRVTLSHRSSKAKKGSQELFIAIHQ